MKVTKRLDLELLVTELTQAAVPHNGLGTRGTENPSEPTEVDLFTYGTDGFWVELPPEAIPVVDAHVAPPRAVEYAGVTSFDAVLRTTDATPVEITRIPTLPQHVYRATVRITGIDAQNGTTRDTEARMVFKRLAAGLAQVGATAILANFADTAAASWAILPTVDGSDLVLSVRGAAGRSIDWLTVGEVAAYAPNGLPPPPTG